MKPSLRYRSPTLVLLLAGSALGAPPRSTQPEAETLRAASALKKISESEWENIAGSQLQAEYAVEKGDTLTGISKRLFGDGKYWPKIWAINQGQITNPHLIRPGSRILFRGGSLSELPQVLVADASGQSSSLSDAPADDIVHKLPDGEWKRLPHQAWENVELQLPPSIDPNGFDLRSKVSFGKAKSWDAPSVTSSEKLATLGKIQGSRRDAENLISKDIVFIAADADLVPETVYAITSGPEDIEGSELGRSGYVYPITGQVRIIGVRDRVFIGEITNTTSLMRRGDQLIPLPATISTPRPIPGPEALSATLLENPEIGNHLLAQHQLVYVDRGSKDGIAPGMIFRAYSKTDPLTGDELSDLNIVVHSDVQVIQTSEEFSLAWVLRSSGLDLRAGQPLVLLTNVTEFGEQRGFEGAKAPESPQDMDELDRLDDGSELTDEQKKELKQLEEWRNNPAPPPGDLPPPPPVSETAPSDLPPPPPVPETAPNDFPPSPVETAPLEAPTSGDALPPLPPPPPVPQ